MGAVSVANRKDGVQGNRRVVEADVTFSNSYATGGDDVVMSAIGLKQVVDVVIANLDLANVAVPARGPQSGVSTRVLTFSPLKIALFTSQDVEALAASDQTAVTIRLRFLGS